MASPPVLLPEARLPSSAAYEPCSIWISVPVSLQLIARYRLSAGHRTTPTKFEGVVARGQAWGRQRLQRLCLESSEPRHRARTCGRFTRNRRHKYGSERQAQNSCHRNACEKGGTSHRVTPLLRRRRGTVSAPRARAVRGLRHEPAKLLRLPGVGLHLLLGKTALQSQDVLQIFSFGQLVS